MLDSKTRASVAHVLLALINADNVIDEGEIVQFADLKKKYGILPKDLQASDTMSFADAVNNIVEYAAKRNERRFLHDFYTSVKEMAISDGFCAQCEARMIYALKSIFFGGQDSGIRLFACAESMLKVEGPKVFFVREESHALLSKEFTEYFHEYYYEFLNYGFELINVSAIREELVAMGKENIVELMTIGKPDLLRSKAAIIYDELKKMSPQCVFKEILGGSLDVLNDGQTSYFLIKVCDSKVSSQGSMQTYRNFIRVPVDPDGGMKKVIRTIVKDYSDCATHLTPIILPADFHKFRYFSFTRSLFGFLEKLVDSRSRCLKRLVIDAVKETVHLEGILDEPVKADYKEIAIYILVSWMTSQNKMVISKGPKMYTCYKDQPDAKSHDALAIEKFVLIKKHIMHHEKPDDDPSVGSQSLGGFRDSLRIFLKKTGIADADKFAQPYLPHTVKKNFPYYKDGKKTDKSYRISGYVLGIDPSLIYVRTKSMKDAESPKPIADIFNQIG